MIRIIVILVFFVISINIAISDERTEKLKLMLEKGLISEAEFKKNIKYKWKTKK